MNVKTKRSILAIGIVAVVLAVTLTLILVLVNSCGIENKIEKSLKSVKTATATVVIKDGDEEIYNMNKQVEVIDGGLNVVTTTKKLESNQFGYKEETLGEFIENGTAKDLINLNLNDDIFASKTEIDGVIKAKVLKSNANAFFGVEDAKANSNVVVKIVFEGKKLQEITLSYTLESGRTVYITAVYYY